MIKIASLEDVEVIVQNNIKLALETENIKLDEDTLRAGVSSVIKDKTKGSYYLYVIDDVVVAQLLITYEWSDWRNKNFWWIQSVYVNMNYRNQKVFHKLFNYVECLAKDMDVCGIRLYVDQNNNIAKQAYTNLGMKKSHYNLYEIYF